MIDGDSVLSCHAKERKIRRIVTVLGSQVFDKPRILGTLP